MMIPLTWTDIITAFLNVWPISLMGALAEMLWVRHSGRLKARPLLCVVFRFLQFGTLFSIFGIAQGLSQRGLIPYEMYIIIVLLSTMCSVSSAFLARIGSLPNSSQG
jgi:hypothetical protein